MLESEWETERCSLLDSDVWKATILTASESAKVVFHQHEGSNTCCMLHARNSKWGLWNTWVMTVYSLAVRVYKPNAIIWHDFWNRLKTVTLFKKYEVCNWLISPSHTSAFDFINYCKAALRQLSHQTPIYHRRMALGWQKKSERTLAHYHSSSWQAREIKTK